MGDLKYGPPNKFNVMQDDKKSMQENQNDQQSQEEVKWESYDIVNDEFQHLMGFRPVQEKKEENKQKNG